MLKYFEKTGAYALHYINEAGRMGIFLFYSAVSVIRPPYKIFPVIKQTYIIGTLSIFVILFTGAFTGMVLGLQG
ncbi:MAG: ABC transporter permease, partial [Nitrospirota bacterium]